MSIWYGTICPVNIHNCCHRVKSHLTTELGIQKTPFLLWAFKFFPCCAMRFLINKKYWKQCYETLYTLYSVQCTAIYETMKGTEELRRHLLFLL